MSIGNIKKDRQSGKKVGRPPTNATPIMVRIGPEMLEELDNWRSEQPYGHGRPEAIRRLLEKALKRGK